MRFIILVFSSFLALVNQYAPAGSKAPTSGGGPAYVQSCYAYYSTGNANSFSCTFGSNIGAGHGLVCSGDSYAFHPSSITWSGDSGTWVSDNNSGQSWGGSFAYAAHVYPTGGGTATITATYNGTQAGYPVIGCIEISGTSGYDKGDFAANGSSTSMLSNAITPAVNGEMIIGFGAGYVTSPLPTPTGSFSATSPTAGINGMAFEYYLQPTAASIQASFTQGGNNYWGCIVEAWKP